MKVWRSVVSALALNLVGCSAGATGVGAQMGVPHPEVRFVNASRIVLIEGSGGYVVAFNVAGSAADDAPPVFGEALYLQVEPCEPSPEPGTDAVELGAGRLAIWPHAVVMTTAPLRLEAQLIDPPPQFGSTPVLASVLKGPDANARTERLEVVGIASYARWPAEPPDREEGEQLVGTAMLPEDCLKCDAGGVGSTQCSIAGCNGTPSGCSTACGGGTWACCQCKVFGARCFCCRD